MEEQFYYAGQGFYSSLFIATAYANGWTDEDLTPISREDYDNWINPPEGMYSTWVDGKPVLKNFIPPPDEDVLIGYENKRKELRAKADYMIAPLQDVVDFDEATDEEVARLKAWKQYRIKLVRMEFSIDVIPEWPVEPTI